MSKKKSSASTKFKNVTYKGHTFYCNDCVLINSNGDTKPYIGRIRSIDKQPGSQIKQILVAWFYRPEECLGGRKVFHGERELFASNHYDWCEVSTIDGPCTVQTLRAYQAQEELSDNDFFCRFTYKPATNEFKPDRVPVYCVCEMPYNPDKFMVQCEKCEEWYHPECLHMSRKQVELRSTFCCTACSELPPPKAQRTA